MSETPLSVLSVGIQQSVAAGNKFTGVKSNDSDPSYDHDRDVIVHNKNGSNGEGLIRPYQEFAQRDQGHPFLTGVHILIESGVNWTLYSTSGLGEGGSDNVDDTSYDQQIASSSGSKFIKMREEVMPNVKYRLTSSATSSKDGIVIARFAATLNDGGRFL